MERKSIIFFVLFSLALSRILSQNLYEITDKTPVHDAVTPRVTLIPQDAEIRWFESDHESAIIAYDDKELSFLNYQEDGARIVKAGYDIGFYFISRSTGQPLPYSSVIDGVWVDVYSKDTGNVLQSWEYKALEDTQSPKTKPETGAEERVQCYFYLDVHKIVNIDFEKAILYVRLTFRIGEPKTADYSFAFRKLQTRLVFNFPSTELSDIKSSLINTALESQINVAYMLGLDRGVVIGCVPMFRWERRRVGVIDTLLDNVNLGVAIPFVYDVTFERVGYGGYVGFLIAKDNRTVLQIGGVMVEGTYRDDNPLDRFGFFAGIDFPCLITYLDEYF